MNFNCAIKIIDAVSELASIAYAFSMFLAFGNLVRENVLHLFQKIHLG